MKKLYTIGHSTHPLEEFIEILQHYRIRHLVDIRTVPRSRHVPWFNKDSLGKSLSKEKIKYTHLDKLGGLRKTFAESINTGWHNASFRGFADYMQTKPFFEGLKELNAIIDADHQVAIMCAEAVPWRCHRSLVGDAEIIRHIEVLDIFHKEEVRPHQLTKFAIVNKHTRPYRVFYPNPES
ncbi:hypothetical protein Lbir_0004 [Legionella birminghamensis]|uniref:Uncharacterized conserved protein n=1 Tax=Legionella birminghamensis TaxID=28083 RepID=A0A378IBW5_9GAMM|nr:DUF488 domain-containing protein [Legionella birminghamensis]KTC75935.1 hypothetical protein Lbir_0004 [Legionella birminghamensis]STX32061.1 Uncharacterized conserved protein [Legionella birminghamensis]